MINSAAQAVGNSFSCAFVNGNNFHHAFLWENGSIIDLNDLIPVGSPLELVAANDINDRGEIAGEGVPPGGDPNNYATGTNIRAFLLIPCDENHPNIESCDYGLVESSITTNSNASTTAKATLTPEVMRRFMRTSGFQSNPWRRLARANSFVFDHPN